MEKFNWTARKKWKQRCRQNKLININLVRSHKNTPNKNQATTDTILHLHASGLRQRRSGEVCWLGHILHVSSEGRKQDFESYFRRLETLWGPEIREWARWCQRAPPPTSSINWHIYSAHIHLQRRITVFNMTNSNATHRGCKTTD